MNPSNFKLDQYSQRLLHLLALVFAGLDVRVLVAKRAVHAATIVLETNTVVLHPDLANLYDLAVCARIMTRRKWRTKGPADPKRDDWLTRKAHREWVPEIHQELLKAFPGILQLPGRFRPGENLEGLRVVARSVEWNPLPPLPRKSQTSSSSGSAPSPVLRSDPFRESRGFEFEEVPELEITGADADFSWLIEALENDYFLLQKVPGLEELSFLRVPFRLCVSEACSRIEVIEQWRSDTVSKEMIRDFEKCIREKSEVRQERLNLGRHTSSGIHLDTNRLVDAVVARRVGREPQLFRKPGSTIEPIFDGSEHVLVLEFDINDLRPLDDWLEQDRRSTAVQRMLALMLTTYQNLEVDCVVLGFADQLVPLKDGRTICLHFLIPVKGIEEEFGDAFWNRLDHLLNHPPRFPGVPTCFHPLAFQEISRTFDRIGREYDHSYRTMALWARRGMHCDFPEFHTADFLMRTADYIDNQVREMENRFTGTLDTLASFLPMQLKNHGRPGQYLQEIEIF